MKRTTALASVLLTAVALSGCGGGSSSSSSSPADAELTATTPAPSGAIDSVNWGLAGSEPDSLDWIYDWDYGPANLIQSNVCEGLMRQNPDGSTTPALATAVDTPDDTTYVFTIRDGVTFTDGQPMTAQDVAFSLNRHLTAEPPSYWSLWYGNVASIEATSDTQVTVTLTQPDEVFLSVMSTPAGYVGEQAYIEAQGADYGTPAGGIMCTGPFSLQSWNKGQNVVLEANPDYWDTELTPQAQTITFSFIPDPAALTNALMTGEVDGAYQMSNASLQTLQNSDSGDLYLNEGSEVVGMQFNDLTTGPLQDQRIREALRDLIDYDGITQGLLGGYAQPSKNSAPAPTWGYSESIFEEGYDGLAGGTQDLDAARALIEEAGAPSEPIVIAVSTDDPSIVNAVTSIQASAQDLGLDVEIRQLPQSEYVNLFYDEEARAGINAMVSAATTDVPDPMELIVQVAPGAPFNYTKITDDDLTATIAEATQTADDDARATLYNQAAQTINDNVYSLSLYSLYTRLYMGERITGAPVQTLSQWYYPWAATIGAR